MYAMQQPGIKMSPQNACELTIIVKSLMTSVSEPRVVGEQCTSVILVDPKSLSVTPIIAT